MIRALPGLMFVVASALAVAQAPVRFPVTVWPTDDTPGEVELGDFDSDGAVDAVVATPFALEVLDGDGGGGFAPPRTLVQGCVSSSFELVDLDRDGWLDLVAGTCAGLSVLRSDHAGGVLPPQIVGGVELSEVGAADVDGDGALDLVAWDGVQDAAVVLLAQGAGFAAPLVHQFGFEHSGRLRCGDVDGDGDVDLALVFRGSSPWTTRVVVASGAGDGTFGERWSFDAIYAADVELGDIDGDGAVELLPGGFGTLRAYSYAGAGRFASRELSAAWGPSPSLVDVDLDGDLDIARPGWTSTVELLVNDGSGQFSERRSIHSCETGIDAAFGDLNGDHALDFVATRLGSGLCVTLATQPGLFAARRPVPLPWNRLHVVGDLDSDGIDDVVAFGAGGHFESYVNDGLGGFDLRWRAHLPASTFRTQLVDLDGDGDRDWVGRLEDAAQSLFTCANDGSGRFATAVVSALPLLGEEHLADIDGDGRADLVAAAVPIRVWRGDGLGGFGSPVATPPAGYPRAADLGDLDGDGRADLVYALATSGLAVQLGRANASFGPALSPAISVSVEALELGQFDGDGLLDMAFVTRTPPQLVRARGDGAGGFHSLAVVAIEPFSIFTPVLALARFDRDALDDIALVRPFWMQAQGWSTFVVYTARGTTGFDQGTEIPVPWFFERPALGDFDGDQRADVVTCNDATRRVELLLQR